MLAELAAANAAYHVIKQAVTNGNELANYAKHISKWVGAEEDLQKKVDKQKNSVFNKILGKEGDDFEEFMALDKIKQQKSELVSYMRLYGRAGLYDDWVAYQAQARKARRDAIKQRQQEIDRIKEITAWIVIVVVVWGGAGAGLYLLIS
jgi:type I site-specific restriction-modification system R (restriction) subunit